MPDFVVDFEMRLYLTLLMLKSVLAERPRGGRDNDSLDVLVATPVLELLL